MSAGRTIRGKTKVRAMHRASRASYAQVELAFLLQDWEDAYNVGGMFRVADAVGAAELAMAGRTPCPPDPQIHVTSLGQHRRVPWRRWDRPEEAAVALREEGYQLVAVEIADGAVAYDAYPYSERVCLVLGNEGQGVYGSVMRHCEGAVYIPMFGRGRSLNVHVAAAVVAFQIRTRPIAPG